MLFISNEFCDLGITRVRDGELTAESQQQASNLKGFESISNHACQKLGVGETGDKPCQESQKTCFPVLLCGLFQHSINKDSSTSAFHNFGDCKESSSPLDSLRKMKALHSVGFSESLAWGCAHLQAEKDRGERGFHVHAAERHSLLKMPTDN